MEATRVRFQLDEHVANAVAEALRRRGIYVVTANDAGLRGRTDLELLEYAHREQRVIVTSDRDFLRLHHDGHPHSGIAFYGQRTHSIGDIVTGLVLIAGILRPGELEMHLEYL